MQGRSGLGVTDAGCGPLATWTSTCNDSARVGQRGRHAGYNRDRDAVCRSPSAA